MNDLRFAFRQLLKNPGFTAVAVLTLALGIGANTAIFQLLNALRLKTLPVSKPQELIEVRIVGGNPGLGISYAVFCLKKKQIPSSQNTLTSSAPPPHVNW